MADQIDINEPAMKIFNVRVDEATYNKIQKLRTEHYVNVSQLVRLLLINFFNEVDEALAKDPEGPIGQRLKPIIAKVAHNAARK